MLGACEVLHGLVLLSQRLVDNRAAQACVAAAASVLLGKCGLRALIAAPLSG
jgi:hypothetical protein